MAEKTEEVKTTLERLEIEIRGVQKKASYINLNIDVGWENYISPHVRNIGGYFERLKQLVPELNKVSGYLEIEDGIRLTKKRSSVINFNRDEKTMSYRREGLDKILKNYIVLISSVKDNLGIGKIETREKKLLDTISNLEEELKIKNEEIGEWKEKLEEITGMGMFREKDLLIEVFTVAYGIFKNKEPLARFLPPLEKCGEHIRSSGNPKNYGTNLIGIYSVLHGKQVSGDMNIDDLIKYDPNSMPGLINELDKLFEDIINHYQTELRQS